MADLINRHGVSAWLDNMGYPKLADAIMDKNRFPSAQSSEEYEWCHDCREYDKDAHCCHRWTKAIRKTVKELEATWPKQRWIPCSEKLPEINQTVLLSTTDGEVIVGYRYKPDIVWQVTANDGRKIWVYDPENYSGNIDELPKAETCGFEDRDNCWLSVTSINYDKKFAGISAWMPLPEPPKEVDHETD